MKYTPATNYVLLFFVAPLAAALAWFNGHPVTTPSVKEPPAQAASLPPPAQPAVPPAVPALDKPLNILFMGTDVVYSRNGRQAAPDPTSYQGNSDTMMFVHFDPAAQKIAVLNIPRDTEVTIPRRGTSKINAANAMGGPALAEQTVSSLLGAPVDNFLVMNVHGLVQMVNELGGITVYVPKRMQYMDWTAKLKIDLQPGFHTLTGNQAMGFVRFRHDALGDIGRVQRQQIFLDAVSNKLKDPRTWSHFPALLQIAQNNIKTDLPPLTLLQLGSFAHALPKQNFQYVLLPGTFGPTGNWIVDQQQAQRVAARVLGVNEQTEAAATDKNQITIAVENVSSDPGLARRVSRVLRRRGYSAFVNRPFQQSGSTKDTQIIAQRGNVADAQAIWNELGQHGSIVNSSIGDIRSNVTVLVGDDMQDFPAAQVSERTGERNAE